MQDSPLKNITKRTALFFAVGVLLALSVPYLAAAIGLGAGEVAALKASHAPLWTGTFFAAFGAIDAAIAPAFDYLFGDKDKAPTKEPSEAKQVTINLQQAPQQMQAPSIDGDWSKKIKTERVILLSGQPQRLQ